MAARFGAKGARILSVSPGSFDSAMGRLEKESGSERLVACAALKRFGPPEEFAELLAFCAMQQTRLLHRRRHPVRRRHQAGLTLQGMLALARGRDHVELITRSSATASGPGAARPQPRPDQGADSSVGGLWSHDLRTMRACAA